jgi:hypothetical protein
MIKETSAHLKLRSEETVEGDMKGGKAVIQEHRGHKCQQSGECYCTGLLLAYPCRKICTAISQKHFLLFVMVTYIKRIYVLGLIQIYFIMIFRTYFLWHRPYKNGCTKTV